jgi:pimeloyl-ACP methyl ester carboxylesterase
VGIAGGLVLAWLVPLVGQDQEGEQVVILKDGFVLQGAVRKEVTTVMDKASGQFVTIVKANGFDLIDEGPKVVVFSEHVRQKGAVAPRTQLRPKYRVYRQEFVGRVSSYPLPAGMSLLEAPEFNQQWRRRIKVRTPLGFESIDQQILSIDPYYIYIVSPTHVWRIAYRTNEWDPQAVRRLLLCHPELAESDGQVDAGKRIALARFMLDAGWLAYALQDIAAIRQAYPQGVPAAEREAFETLVRDAQAATAELTLKEAEAALSAARYQYLQELSRAFPTDQAQPAQIERFTAILAQAKTLQERYTQARAALRQLLDQLTGLHTARGLLATAGTPALVFWPRKSLADDWRQLVDAGETVYSELHPELIDRLDTFLTLHTQMQREQQQGRDPTHNPKELLAVAISGWIKGRNGATPNPHTALRLWQARRLLLDYARDPDASSRHALLTHYLQNQPLPPEEIAQILMLLPPVEPENLLFRSGTLLPPLGGRVADMYRRTTPATTDNPQGIPYLLRLPPEYHHGRPWPLLIVLTHTTIPAAEALASVAREADRYGFIVAAPDWTNAFATGWKWNGLDHPYVTDVLRDIVRHFCVDNDRVYLLGYAEGANMALDVALSHPDLFAALAAFSPRPLWTNFLSEYWTNAQKLPCYIVTGEFAGDALQTLRRVFEKWMPRGFPALLHIYKGRGLELYPVEIPTLFDWLHRKRRVGNNATLALGPLARPPWTTMRASDNRFYWLGAEQIENRRLIDYLPAGRLIVPATVQGDILGDNHIVLRTLGIQRLTLHFTRELIDWTKPVRITVNGSSPSGYRAQRLTPDLETLLEDYRLRGDRRNPVLARLELKLTP